MLTKSEYEIYRQEIISKFWKEFYRDIEVKLIDKKHKNLCYNSEVMEILIKNKNLDKSNNELLKNLQRDIEGMSNQFCENNIFNETPNLVKILIGKDLISAKSYLYKHLPIHIYNSTIDHLGQYKLEAIIIYVIGLLFNCLQQSSIVRVSTLLDKLDTNVRIQANIIKNNKMVTAIKDKDGSKKVSSNKDKDGNKYEIGTKLLEFMIERKLIHIELITDEDKIPVVKKTGKGYLETNLFAVCDFDISLIPIKLNLPMVCMPENWVHITELDNYFNKDNKPLVLSDMVGGYLSSPSLDIYNSFILENTLDINTQTSLLSTRNLSNFNIELNNKSYKEMCNILNGLQKQGFKINKKMLDFINRNRDTLEKSGSSYAWNASTRES